MPSPPTISRTTPQNSRLAKSTCATRYLDFDSAAMPSITWNVPATRKKTPANVAQPVPVAACGGRRLIHGLLLDWEPLAFPYQEDLAKQHRAGGRAAASSVAHVLVQYAGSLRPCITTSSAPRRRAPFRQTLLAAPRGVEPLHADSKSAALSTELRGLSSKCTRRRNAEPRRTGAPSSRGGSVIRARRPRLRLGAGSENCRRRAPLREHRGPAAHGELAAELRVGRDALRNARRLPA